MTVYVFRNGVIRPKGADRDVTTGAKRSAFPAPMVSRMEPFESPVTGKEISSWRERERDMAAAGAVDPRDLPPPSRGSAKKIKEAKHVRPEPADDAFRWGGIPNA